MPPSGWFPDCYTGFQNILPAPVVSLEVNGVQSLYVAPDSVDLITLFGTDYTDLLDSLNFNWQRLAGAKVVAIEGMDPYAYVDFIAKTVSGNYLDHGVRVNSVLSSYRISGTDFSQRVGECLRRLIWSEPLISAKATLPAPRESSRHL